MEPCGRWRFDISETSFGFKVIWKVGSETLNSRLVWSEQQSQSGDVWFSALEQHVSRAKRSKYKAGSGPVLWGCSMDVQHKWKRLWTLCVHSRRMTHQAKQVTLAFFIRRKRETESVESSLTIPVTFCFRSTMHSCPIMNACTIIITTRMHAARTNPNSITEGELPHIRIRQGGNPTQRKLTDLCPSISAKDGLEF